MISFRKLFASLCLITSLIFCFSLVQKYTLDNNPTPKVDETVNRRYLVNTPGCQIPVYDPFDSTISHLYSSVGNLTCGGPLPLVRFNRTHVILNVDEVRKQFGKARCFYRAVQRKDDGKSDDRYEFSRSKELLTAVKVTNEFIQVDCKNEMGDFVYTELIPFIQVKPKLESSCTKNHQTWVSKTNHIRERLSVTIIGLDSVSRLNMLRQMPKTYNYLTTHMTTIDLQGFVKVADNTFVNVVPFLAGVFARQCWNETLKSTSLNYLNLIWKNFSSKGYRTLFAEDDPGVAAFNYLKTGFWSQPTDYYFRPFTLAVRDSSVQNWNLNCYNRRPEAEVSLQWLLDFLITFKPQNKPTFSFLFNTRLTHNDLNFAGYADQIYLDFLQQHQNHNLDHNSILIFFSDHGIRFGDIRNTYVGKIEERMPFVFLSFPPKFPQKYPKIWKNLKKNQNRLTTFFDLHETLKQILHFDGQIQKSSVKQRGISFFSEIPVERTCVDAAILPHWCTCNEKMEIARNDSRVKKSAELMISGINKYLMKFGDKCAKLSVKRILDARASVLRDEVLKFRESRNDVIDREVVYGKRLHGIWEFLITVSVFPSGAVFEGTVRYFEENGGYKVDEEVSRINMYKKTSGCVGERKAKKFCYCVK